MTESIINVTHIYVIANVSSSATPSSIKLNSINLRFKILFYFNFISNWVAIVPFVVFHISHLPRLLLAAAIVVVSAIANDSGLALGKKLIYAENFDENNG